MTYNIYMYKKNIKKQKNIIKADYRYCPKIFRPQFFFHIRQPVQTAHAATLSSTELRTGASKSDFTVDRKYKQVHYIREINRFNIVD